MALKVAKRAAIPPFFVMEVMRAANQKAAVGDKVLHLEVGQPSTGAPQGVIDAARTALDDDRLGYTDALGIPDLRRRIADHYMDYYGLEVDERRVVVSAGSSGAFPLAFLSAFEAGDRVALASPGYPAYRNILRALGVEPVSLAVGADSHFQPSVAHLKDLKTSPDGLIVASPSNPTGSVIADAAMEELVAYCAETGIRLTADEIYHGITYGRKARTALSLSEDVIVVNSFSKYFSMTGWRLGWMVIPDGLLRAVECVAQNLFISPPTLAQIAAVAAFDCRGELDANVARYARNRDLLLAQLPMAGFEELAPADGAFYIYADVRHLTDDSRDFCRRMLDETGMAATPGVDFDPSAGHCFVRFSFAGATEEMAEAARRLRAWRR